MQDLLLVYITTATLEEAKLLANDLVQNRLAACANIVPAVHSVFHWQGRLEQKEESLLLLKTNKATFAKLSARVQSLHSYELPCIVALPLSEALPQFAAWVSDELRQG